MRKVTQNAVNAFIANTRFGGSNTQVTTDENETKLWLHGHCIAKKNTVSGEIVINDRDWQTSTTKERLNGLLSNLNLGYIFQKNWNWYYRSKEGTIPMFSGIPLIVKEATPIPKPRYIRIYDNQGSTLDRYTIVFTGRYRHKTGGDFMYIGASEKGLGVFMHGHSDMQIDRPTYSHLGKKIKWSDLDRGLQSMIVESYDDLWK